MLQLRYVTVGVLELICATVYSNLFLHKLIIFPVGNWEVEIVFFFGFVPNPKWLFKASLLGLHAQIAFAKILVANQESCIVFKTDAETQLK